MSLPAMSARRALAQAPHPGAEPATPAVGLQHLARDARMNSLQHARIEQLCLMLKLVGSDNHLGRALYDG